MPKQDTSSCSLYTKGYMSPLKAHYILLPPAPLLVLADEKALYLVEFLNKTDPEEQTQRISQKRGFLNTFGRTTPIEQLEEELKEYAIGKRTSFQTPIRPLGTAFQQKVWHALQQIPYGQTRSYAQIAQEIGVPTGYRAVAQANRSNPLSIIIPCHRVIYANGTLGGYAGGIDRKKWLLHLESSY